MTKDPTVARLDELIGVVADLQKAQKVSLSKLTVKAQKEVFLTTPEGEKLSVFVRGVSDTEQEEIRQTVTWPKKLDFKTGELARDPDTKKIGPVIDEDKYNEAQRKANTEYSYRLLVIAVQDSIDIPGETLTEKTLSLRSELGGWALRKLTEAVFQLSGLSEEEVQGVYENLVQQRS